MEFELSAEQQLIRETAREFTDNEIVPWARDNDRDGHFDLELVGKVAAHLYEGTSQIQKLIIGRALTGINALVPS